MKALPSLWTLAALLVVALVAVPVQGRAERPQVKHYVDDFAESVSPDGRAILFQRQIETVRYETEKLPRWQQRRTALFLMRTDGSHKRVLRPAGAIRESDASFSPDGRSILFVRGDRIHLMRRDGSGARLVRRDFVQQKCPRFSPDGSKISLWRGTAGSHGAYFVMNADGTGLRRISSTERYGWGCPSWFPDGKRLVYARNNGTGQDLYVVSADGTEVKRITDEGEGLFFWPAVSPDGDWIACGRQAAGHRIAIMRADGTGLRVIPTGADEFRDSDWAPLWSPDGRQIVFSSNRGHFKGSGVYIVNRDGSGLRRLSNFRR